MKIIIAGTGKVGTTLTALLSASGYDITVVDTKPSVLETSVEKYDVMAVQGNCATMDTLVRAGVEEADLLIAATGADEVNLLCCITAHGLNSKLHTIARVRNPEYIDQINKMQDTYALSLVVNPDREAAVEIERLIKFPGFLKRDSFAKGRVEIVELRIGADSKLCNLALSDLSRVVKCRVLVCTVLRQGSVIAPDGNFVIKEGDRIFVTAPTANLTELLSNLGIVTKKVHRVMICGGGRISYYLAQQLEKDGFSVQIIEHSLPRCHQLAETLTSTDIVNDDASNPFSLEREGLAGCDALVTATGMDELNMIISLYGTNSKIPLVITKLGHMESTALIDRLELGCTVSPKDICCNGIVRYVRAMHNQTGAAISVHAIADGKAEALEFKVDSKTRHCGTPLKDIRIKDNVLVACITKNGVTELPGGLSSFDEGDTVVIVSTRKDVIYQLNDIFE